MSQVDQFLRWLNILTAIQANPGITAGELAKFCNVSARTIYRDLDRLTSTLPINSEGHGKGYKFMGNFKLYPLNLTNEEAVSLSIIPSIVDKDKLPAAFNSAYNKIMATHNAEKRDGYKLIEHISELIQTGRPAYSPKSRNYLSHVIQAMLESRTIYAIYHSQHRNVTTERYIDPYYLVPREQRFYLIGFCHREKRAQTFRLSRFQHVEITEKRFNRDSFDIAKYMENTWSIHRGDKKITFKIKFSANVARYVKEEELFVQPWMKDTADGGLLFQVTVNNEDEFIRWLLQYGADAEIISPPSAREAMKRRLNQWSRLYGE